MAGSGIGRGTGGHVDGGLWCQSLQQIQLSPAPKAQGVPPHRHPKSQRFQDLDSAFVRNCAPTLINLFCDDLKKKGRNEGEERIKEGRDTTKRNKNQIHTFKDDRNIATFLNST